MREALLIAVRAVVGGAFVVAFSLLGEMLRPKSFAGIFAAAPSIALGSLLIIGLSEGPTKLYAAALGMLLGAIVLAFSLLVGIDSVKRFRARTGSLMIIGTWLAGASALYAVAFR